MVRDNYNYIRVLCINKGYRYEKRVERRDRY